MQNIKDVPQWTYIPQKNDTDAVLVKCDGTAVIKDGGLITKDRVVRDGEVVAKKNRKRE